MLICGDLHGKYLKLSLIIQETDEDNIIQVGDFGLGFKPLKEDMDDLEALDKLLKDNGGKRMFIVRGNHDNPTYWQPGSPFDNVFNNITLVTDYSVINIEGVDILFIGGGISIDRVVRIKGSNYWEDEGVDYDEQKLLEVDRNIDCIDVIVSHVCPDFAFPSTLSDLVHNYSRIDDNLILELELERQLLTRLYEILKKRNSLKDWFYGHYHHGFEEKIGDTTFTCVGCEEFVKF